MAFRARLLQHPRWRWLALLVVASGMMLSVVNVSIVNIALPTMAADLGVDVPSISWVVTGFLVTQATLLALAGRAGDLYGRRRIFVTGVLVLCAALGPLRPGVERPLAGGVPDPPGRRGLRDGADGLRLRGRAVRRPRERGVALGVMGGVLGLAPVLSLNIAGVLVGHARLAQRLLVQPGPRRRSCWRAPRWCSSSRSRRDADRDFDLPGAALAAVGLFSVLVALSRGEAWGWGSGRPPRPSLLGAASLALFARHELRTAQPDDRPAAAAPPVPRHGEPRRAWRRRRPSSGRSSCCPST